MTFHLVDERMGFGRPNETVIVKQGGFGGFGRPSLSNKAVLVALALAMRPSQ